MRRVGSNTAFVGRIGRAAGEPVGDHPHAAGTAPHPRARDRVRNREARRSPVPLASRRVSTDDREDSCDGEEGHHRDGGLLRGGARDGKVLCFFRSGLADKTRYSVFGFDEAASLDEDSGMWPTPGH